MRKKLRKTFEMFETMRSRSAWSVGARRLQRGAGNPMPLICCHRRRHIMVRSFFALADGEGAPAVELGEVDPVAQLVDDVGGLVRSAEASGDLHLVLTSACEVGQVAHQELYEVAQHDVIELAACHVAMDDGHALVTLPAVGEGEHVELLAILRTCAPSNLCPVPHGRP